LYQQQINNYIESRAIHSEQDREYAESLAIDQAKEAAKVKIVSYMC